tara:strand:- start:1843 stop:1995 length:153 start_codon:yes stop_codon:yes gene_type:complete
MTVIHTDKGKVPVLKGYTTERAIEILEEGGHTILHVEEVTARPRKVRQAG